MKERYNTSKVSKQRKQLIWNLKFHPDYWTHRFPVKAFREHLAGDMTL